ncbi:MAG TPA: hypothetical protein VNO22_16400 [Planctomycetota bacterium]|nr:hypothetical protein [Planctomycetota bacterium]
MRKKKPARRTRGRTPRRPPVSAGFREEFLLEIDRIERHLREGTQKAEGDRDE